MDGTRDEGLDWDSGGAGERFYGCEEEQGALGDRECKAKRKRIP